jgi:CubicO group peptidase (beta-lactamase class C family)
MTDVADISARLAAPYHHPATTVIVLLADGERTTVTAYGNANTVSSAAPEDLIFEIGSITKVFTAILLAHLSETGLVDPDQGIGDVCKAFACAPRWITARRLATHTSGLPRLHIPLRKLVLSPVPADPYSDFERDDLVAWIKTWRPSRPPGPNAYAYSNLGVGLLGEVLACSQHQDYELLLRDMVLTPLGLADAAFSLSAEQKQRFMQPHSASGMPVIPWTFRALAGAGALRASANDLCRLARRVVTAIASPLSPMDRAIATSAEPQVGLGPRGAKVPVAQCLGWIRMAFDPAGPWMLFHDGGTAGSASALYVCPAKRGAIVVLANRGVSANAWSSFKLSWSNPHRIAQEYFAGL